MPEVLLISHGVVVFTDPVAAKPHPTRYWAQGGLVHWEDQVTSEYGTLTVANALERVKAINQMIGNSRKGQGYQRPDECQKYQNFVADMLQLMARAREQGMPDDPAHSKQLVAGIKAKRQSKLLVTPGLNKRF